ncbi:MAG: hypothetical protein RI883_100 [Bacteroidota bacterium]|jgi:hypothetical protein
MGFKPADEIIDLETAIANKLISVEFISNGEYSGESLIMKVKNLNSKKMEIRINAGTYFAAPSDDEQNLIIPQEDFIVLEPKGSKEKLLNGYCTNMGNAAPNSGGLFVLKKSNITGMQEFITLIKGKTLESYTIQSAIWALTDHESVSNVDGENSAEIDVLRKELFKITGQKETWYKSRQEYAVSEDRQINTETLAINGKLKFQTVKGAIIHEEIYDSEGKILFKLSESVVKLGGEVGYEFNLKVKGWKKGNYEIRLMDGTKLVKTFEFIV